MVTVVTELVHDLQSVITITKQHVTVSVRHGNSVQYVWHVNKELDLNEPIQTHQPNHFLFVLGSPPPPLTKHACNKGIGQPGERSLFLSTQPISPYGLCTSTCSHLGNTEVKQIRIRLLGSQFIACSGV